MHTLREFIETEKYSKGMTDFEEIKNHQAALSNVKVSQDVYFAVMKSSNIVQDYFRF
jgi:hypothetical protein